MLKISKGLDQWFKSAESSNQAYQQRIGDFRKGKGVYGEYVE